jgi:hypothetical protein
LAKPSFVYVNDHWYLLPPLHQLIRHPVTSQFRQDQRVYFPFTKTGPESNKENSLPLHCA